jgi:anti-sigma regulatory factor (Ser/Thr protein kinase)
VISRFRHEALLYESQDDLVATARAFIQEGVAAGEPVLVAVPERNGRLIRSAVGEERDVEFVDMEGVGRNPARILPVWQRFVAESQRRGRNARGIGEPMWPGRGEAEIDECERHEALMNVAFARGPSWRLVCPYDASRLPDAVIERAAHTHARILTRRGSAQSRRYSLPAGREVAFGGTFPAPPASAAHVWFGPAELAAVRNLVSEHALRLGLGVDRAADLVIAANEVATNSVRHGGGGGTLRIWGDGGAVVCEVRDAGRFSDPLSGRRFPAPDSADGRGLWIANQLCDLVQVRSSQAGSAVRLRMDQAASE